MSAKQLLLLRHAKSDWHAGAADDFSRPLNARGRDDASRLGRWFKNHQLIPEIVAVSPAARTMQTWELMRAEFADAPPPEVFETRELYSGTAAEIFDAAAAHLQNCARLLIIAHNPAMEDALRAYRPSATPFSDGKFMPTCALAILELQAATADSGDLSVLLRPNDF